MTLEQTVRAEVQSLGDHLSGEETVAVAIPDNTRPVAYPQVIPPILEQLAEQSIEVTVVVGNGLHREMTDDELRPVQATCDRTGSALVQHDATDPAENVRLEDDVSDGRVGWPTLPLTVNQYVHRADRVVSIGTVEPHQYAGFSGGAKGIAIGCGGEPTISAMHGLEFLRHPGTRLGHIEGNQFQHAVWSLADWLDRPIGVQLVPAANHEGGDVAVFAGSLAQTYETAVELATERFFEEHDRRFDWLELPIPPEKATNFYQASRAATYAALVDSPAIARGGTLIIDAPCPEGIGRGSGEQACEAALRRGVRTLVEELESDREIQTRGGEQRAYVIARTLDRFDVALVGADTPLPLLQDIGIRQFETTSDAREALDLGSNGRVIEDIFHNVPVYRDSSGGFPR